MNMLTLSKILDTLSLIAIVAVVALYLFLKLTFIPLACMLMGVCIIKMIAQMLKAKFFEKKYNELAREHGMKELK